MRRGWSRERRRRRRRWCGWGPGGRLRAPGGGLDPGEGPDVVAVDHGQLCRDGREGGAFPLDGGVLVGGVSTGSSVGGERRGGGGGVVVTGGWRSEVKAV